jgi:hypothetical protein
VKFGMLLGSSAARSIAPTASGGGSAHLRSFERRGKDRGVRGVSYPIRAANAARGDTPYLLPKKWPSTDGPKIAEPATLAATPIAAIVHLLIAADGAACAHPPA